VGFLATNCREPQAMAAYTRFGCVSFSNNDEYYMAYTTQNIKQLSTDACHIKINNPDFTKSTMSHGVIVCQVNK
jgi:hypothetical protein